MPSPALRLSSVIALEVSISDLDGTQSVSTQAPPGPSESATVTSAPSWAATRAASSPPGPPPRSAILWRGRVTVGILPGGLVAVRYQGRGNALRPATRRRALAPVALYAAYGSNLDPAQMLVRCPHSPQRGTGGLEGWRLPFGGGDIGWGGGPPAVGR